MEADGERAEGGALSEDLNQSFVESPPSNGLSAFFNDLILRGDGIRESALDRDGIIGNNIARDIVHAAKVGEIDDDSSLAVVQNDGLGVYELTGIRESPFHKSRLQCRCEPFQQKKGSM